MWADRFENVSIILPALNETFSFEETVRIILDECRHEDIREMIAVVATEPQKNVWTR